MPKPYANVTFEPDQELIVKVAEWLSDRPKGEAYMVTARGVLAYLVKLGLSAHIDGQADG